MRRWTTQTLPALLLIQTTLAAPPENIPLCVDTNHPAQILSPFLALRSSETNPLTIPPHLIHTYVSRYAHQATFTDPTYSDSEFHKHPYFYTTAYAGLFLAAILFNPVLLILPEDIP